MAAIEISLASQLAEARRLFQHVKQRADAHTAKHGSLPAADANILVAREAIVATLTRRCTGMSLETEVLLQIQLAEAERIVRSTKRKSDAHKAGHGSLPAAKANILIAREAIVATLKRCIVEASPLN